MPYFARLRGRDSRRRPAPARRDLEALEQRTLLSGTAGSAAASQARISSKTVLTSSFSTAVTGSNLIFTATVENASNDAPIGSGKVNFVIESPQKIVLGDVGVDKQGQAAIATKQLTKIGKYRVEAQYTPSKPKISASVAAPVIVKVIPVPLDVPTTTSLQSGAKTAEVGQFVPLTATVKDAGTGLQVDAGRVEPIKGTVEFFTDSANPIVLGAVPLGKADQASLPTNLLRNAGPYQIEAEFVPANNFFTGSTSAPTAVTITPRTLNAPTVTSLQAVPSIIETGESLTLNATVQNADSNLADGAVEFVTVSRHPVVLAEANATTFGQTIGFATSALKKVGVYKVEAKYLPNTNRFAASVSPPITVTVTPLTAASFLVTPFVRHGHLNQPLGFTVTALNAQQQPLTSYAGTVVVSSPTDSWTTFAPAVYASLHITPPPPQSTGLASFTTQSYSFTAADHGTHTFVDEVRFGKAGAENVQVTQANNSKVFGKATFAIG